ncbi:hypothetical protein cauri_0782 [Corynebacterium aurimucosum ATCC 700975]|uniref:Uncharacterized protein n=1 Tax=Corynebacterium aurimucosum (strain ATCC 700975 / DSM 44827 / CIP 107346 / CN-1) TaxID=548476 RepID=C3PEX5_CORA7|nr:hypothetical protein cauri_0782 [Corynebacterium aurimucosum ATCC 700975]QQU93437.1 hypothetical protein I6I67_01740 [Corynebacterium aurimucosum]TRX36293.1 MFS transporter [Corynebacterium guaraldiae]
MSERSAQERSRKRHGAYSPRLDEPGGSFRWTGRHCPRCTIVGVALPSNITDLQLNLTQAQWVNSLYAVLLAELLCDGARLRIPGDASEPSSPA